MFARPGVSFDFIVVIKSNKQRRARWMDRQTAAPLACWLWVGSEFEPSLSLSSVSRSRGGFARYSSDAERWALWVKGNLRVNLDNPPEPAARNYIWSFFLSNVFVVSRRPFGASTTILDKVRPLEHVDFHNKDDYQSTITSFRRVAPTTHSILQCKVAVDADVEFNSPSIVFNS